MTSQQLYDSLMQATQEQWNKFVSENQSLIMLFEETWKKFAEQQVQKKPIMEYAADRSVESLSHEALSIEQMAVFIEQFEHKIEGSDRPFGDNIEIQEQNWQLLD